MNRQQKPTTPAKKKKTDQICLRLPVKTIDYLNKNKTHEDESTPSVARRMLIDKQTNDEKSGGG